MTAYTCSFCEEFNLGYLKLNSKVFRRILYESKNFIVVPSLGHFIDGYLLILPKKHFICIGEIPFRLYDELEFVISKCKEVLFKAYRKRTILFEHGAVGNSLKEKAGCCKDHAHLHIVPIEINLFNEISKNYHFKKITSFLSLKSNFIKKIPYLFYENNEGERYLFNAPLVVSQYFRKILAKRLNKLKLWDWRSHPEIKNLQRTLKKLRSYF